MSEFYGTPKFTKQPIMKTAHSMPLTKYLIMKSKSQAGPLMGAQVDRTDTDPQFTPTNMSVFNIISPLQD